MSATSDSSRQHALQHELDAIIHASAALPINWEDPDHRPMIASGDDMDLKSADLFGQLQAMTLDFLEESGARETELEHRIADAQRALDAKTPPPIEGRAKASFSLDRAKSLRRQVRSILYATRKANDLEIATLIDPLLKKSCRTARDTALQASLTRLEALAAIMVERIDELGQSETVGASLLYRGGDASRFLVSPLYTSVDLEPDIYVYSASHLVRALSDEVRRLSKGGQVAYIADTDALMYKAVVQWTAHCQFRALRANRKRTAFSNPDEYTLDLSHPETEAWLEVLFGPTRNLELQACDVAISSVPTPLDAATLPELKRKISQTLRQFFSDLGALGPHRERPSSEPNKPPPRMNNLIHDALVERPNRRFFAAAEDERTVWASDDVFTGEAP